MTMPADNTPVTGADASGAGAATQSGTPANPGGAATYNSGGSVATSGGISLLSGIVAPTGQMPTAPAPNIEGLTIPDIIPGSPVHQVGFGKGSKRPDITRLSELVKFVNAINTGNYAGQFNPALLADIAKQAKMSPQEINQLEQGSNPNEGVLSATPAEVQKATKAAWTDIVTHLRSLGVAVPKDVEQAPNAANAVTKLNALGDLRIEQPTVDALRRNGYNTAGMTDVKTLVSGHDSTQFATGAPGTITTVPGTAAHNGEASGAALWDDFVTNWQKNEKVNKDPITGQGIGAQTYQQAMMADLVSAGALDLSAGTTPTVEQVAQAYQSIIQQAASNKQSLPETFQAINDSNPPSTNLDQAYVQHVVDSILGQNALTPFQVTALANLANRQGVSSSAGADAINEGIVTDYLNELSKGGTPITAGSSYAGLAYQTINDTLTQWGVPSTPATVAHLAAQVLQSGINTPYQVIDLAQTATEGYAKQQVGQLYGPGVGALANTGQSVQTQASPYLQTAANLLGTPSSQMSLVDPTGKWMKWSQGGTGPGGTMTQAEWASYLMTDPSYNFDQSQAAKNDQATGANGLLTLFGKLPSSAPNPFQGAGFSSQVGGNA